MQRYKILNYTNKQKNATFAKKQFMLKSFITFLLFVNFCVANAQTDSSVQHSILKREKFRLAVDMQNGGKPIVLKKEQLFSMLSYSQYEGYNHARRCYYGSIPLFAFAAYSTGLGVSLAILGGFEPIIILACGVPMLSFVISGAILINYSKRKLNRTAFDYNSQHKLSYLPVKLHFGFVGNGVGLKLTF
jgi:hypothetical protein